METTQTRANWVDYGKGIGMILVAYAHLLSSAYHAGIQVPERFFNLSDSIIYGFHMPFFFFLSGLFVEGSLQKRGVKAYLRDKFLRVFYPYLIWSVLQVGVEVAFSSQSHQGATLADLFAVYYRPWGQFWFLYALLLMYVTHALFSYFGKYSAPLLFAVSIPFFFAPLRVTEFGLFGFSGHLIFFAGGILFKELAMKAAKYDLPSWGILLLLAALIGSGYYVFTYRIPPLRLVGSPYSFYFLYLSVLGCVAFTALSQYLSRRNSAQFLQTLGLYSLQIYLAHMLAGVGMRMVLLMLGVENWVAQIIIGTTFALAAPILLQKISDKLNFPYLFALKVKE